MRIRVLSILVICLMIFFSNCSKDEIIQLLNPEISFVREDGTKIEEGECVSLKDNIVLEIVLEAKNDAVFKPTTISYSVNNIAYSVTFKHLGVIKIPVILSEGNNTAQIAYSEISTSISISDNCNATIIPESISFVYADGSELPAGECLDIGSSYAVKIEAIKEGEGEMVPTEIKYTLNGVVYSTTFTQAETKIIPIKLSNGENIAQLSGSGISTGISISDNCNATIIPESISFVYADGSELFAGECLDIGSSYAVKIEAIKKGDGEMVPTEIKYTLNGVVYSTTFTQAETKIIPIKLNNGENIAELSGSGISTGISISDNCNATIIPVSISFVYADGTELVDGECRDLNSNYAVKILTKVEGTGPIEVTRIEYTVNGILYNMVFTEAGSKINLVTINSSENTAHVIEYNLEDEIKFIFQDDFRLIE